jgi:exodeoxyribonuclease VII large subunit
MCKTTGPEGHIHPHEKSAGNPMLYSTDQPLLTVTQLNLANKNQLEGRFRFVRVTGEISNLKTPFSGHSYFTLKDGASQLRAVLFKQQKRFNQVTLADGREVLCTGRISVYEPRGEYQLIVDSVELGGSGRLQLEFEKLKRKLAERGYFAAERKKPLPPFPFRIVVISSPTGAAIQDFLKIVRMRQATVHVQILPVRVQGKEAAEEIARALALANRLEGVEVIVLCRGGGSLEDLWAFNEEVVAEAIFRSTLPVVSAIGHETDFTIADFCADYRSPTPTGAAERVIPDATLLRRQIAGLSHRLNLAVQGRLDQLDRVVRQEIRLLGDLRGVFAGFQHRLHLSRAYLAQSISKALDARENALQVQMHALQIQAPGNRITLQQKQLELVAGHLQYAIHQRLAGFQERLARQAALLDGVSPLATLSRGYAVVRRYDPVTDQLRVVTRAVDTRPGEALSLLLRE